MSENKRLQTNRFIRFLGVGVLNTLFGYSVFALLNWAGLPSAYALLIATIIGVLFNFATTGRLVFDNRDGRLIGRFFLIYVLVYLLNLALLRLLQARGLPAIPAQGLCLVLTVPASFILQKLFVFKENGL